jgi:hypothetical protein
VATHQRWVRLALCHICLVPIVYTILELFWLAISPSTHGPGHDWDSQVSSRAARRRSAPTGRAAGVKVDHRGGRTTTVQEGKCNNLRSQTIAAVFGTLSLIIMSFWEYDTCNQVILLIAIHDDRLRMWWLFLSNEFQHSY